MHSKFPVKVSRGKHGGFGTQGGKPLNSASREEGSREKLENSERAQHLPVPCVNMGLKAPQVNDYINGSLNCIQAQTVILTHGSWADAEF